MQENEELTLPITAKKVLIRSYVTGLIDREVKKVQAASNKATYEVDASSLTTDEMSGDQLPQGGKMVMEADPAAGLKADEKLLELMVVAIDGNNGDVYNQLLELPSKDVNFVLDRVKALYAEGEVVGSDPKAPTS